MVSTLKVVGGGSFTIVEIFLIVTFLGKMQQEAFFSWGIFYYETFLLDNFRVYYSELYYEQNPRHEKMKQRCHKYQISMQQTFN